MSRFENLNDKIVTKLRKTDDYITAHQLANEFSVNERTIRRRILLINDSILKDMAVIESFPSKGYKLSITDPNLFSKYYDYLISELGLGNILNRRTALFEALVSYDYINKWDLMDMFFI